MCDTPSMHSLQYRPGAMYTSNAFRSCSHAKPNMVACNGKRNLMQTCSNAKPIDQTILGTRVCVQTRLHLHSNAFERIQSMRCTWTVLYGQVSNSFIRA